LEDTVAVRFRNNIADADSKLTSTPITSFFSEILLKLVVLVLKICNETDASIGVDDFLLIIVDEKEAHVGSGGDTIILITSNFVQNLLLFKVDISVFFHVIMEGIWRSVDLIRLQELIELSANQT
jgi:hypothetical protein